MRFVEILGWTANISGYLLHRAKLSFKSLYLKSMAASSGPKAGITTDETVRAIFSLPMRRN